MRVSVYFNLRTKLWSVRNDKTGRVIGHAHRVLLRGVTFIINKAGQRKVWETGVKNVHAFVRGTLEAADWGGPKCYQVADWFTTSQANDAYLRASRKYGRRVTYNPHLFETFVYANEGGPGGPAQPAPMVSMVATTRSVFAFDPCSMTQEESERATA